MTHAWGYSGMSGETRESIISADRPIEKPADDILGRNNFAVSIAKMISEWKGKESLVIGLYGPWGCGKTSIKNLIIHELKNNESAYCLEFNPWMWSGKKELTETFFSEISRQIFGNKDKSESFKKLALKFKVWRALTPSYEEAKQIIPIGSSILASIIGVFIGRWFEKQVVLSVFFALIVGYCLLFVVNSVLKKFVQYYTIMAEYSSKSISERKDDISADLQKLSKPVVVVIDDIDRLLDNEIAMMFQIVKSNADFDNIVYVLMFDDKIVRTALSKDHFDGVKYLEKIVQIQLSVPVISYSEVERIFIEGVNNILSYSKELLKNHDDARWAGLYHSGIKKYLKSLRDVKRFLASFEFHVGIFSKEDILEVNPDDLIAIDIIRVFESEIYAVIIENKLLLVGEMYSVSTMLSKENYQLRKKDFLEIIENTASFGYTINIIKKLFPILNDEQVDCLETFKKCMICNKHNFDKYFAFAIPNDGISQLEIIYLISSCKEVDVFCSKFRQYVAKGKGDPVLDALESHANVVDKDNSIYFVTALCVLADEYDMGNVFREGHSRKLSLAVYRHLLSCDDYEERAKIIEYALHNSKSLLIVSNLLGHDRSVDAEKSLTSRVLNEAGTKRISIVYVEIFNGEIERSPATFFCKKEFRSICFTYSQINGKESLYSLMSKYIDIQL
jgi:GTPase SAR1 family protein